MSWPPASAPEATSGGAPAPGGGGGGVRQRRDDRPVYVISIAADLAGLHPRTLRIYEEKGLVQPARRNNTRLYSDRDLERVRLIRHLTHGLGLNLDGVRVRR